MAILKLKKGYNLDLAGQIADNEIVEAPVSTTCAITPDDFCGIVPRLDKKKGETVVAGEAIYHDKMHEAIKIVSPVSGIIVAVNRGERRKIESIVIERDGEDKQGLRPQSSHSRCAFGVGIVGNDASTPLRHCALARGETSRHLCDLL